MAGLWGLCEESVKMRNEFEVRVGCAEGGAVFVYSPQVGDGLE